MRAPNTMADRHQPGRHDRRCLRRRERTGDVVRPRRQGRWQVRPDRDHGCRLSAEWQAEQPAAGRVQAPGREALRRDDDRDDPHGREPDADPPRLRRPVIDKVKSGVFQMAVVPARAWSAAGVTSLKALQAPFLFESDEHVAALVNDAAITTDLFSGFDGSGVTGLTLFPESLRHLFSFGEPILTPADVQGRTIRAISSLETTALIEALGGRAVDPDDDAYQQGIADGTIQGTDSGFSALRRRRPRSHLDRHRQRRPVREGHDAGHQQCPVDRPRRRPARHHQDCVRRHPDMGHRQPGQGRRRRRDVLRRGRHRRPGRRCLDRRIPRRRSPVYAALEADPATRRAIAAIRALDHRDIIRRRGRSVRAGSSTTAKLRPDGGDAPERDLPCGVHGRLSDKPGGDPDVSEQSRASDTYRLEDGHWTIDTIAGNYTQHPHIEGIYQVVGHDIFWRWDNDHGPARFAQDVDRRCQGHADIRRAHSG